MRTILVPTDFSNCSEEAVKYAIHFATKTGRKLLFFHSTFLLIPTRSSSMAYMMAVKSNRSQKLKQLITFIDKVYDNLNIKKNDSSIKFIVKYGPSVVENIIEAIQEQFIDLIIMGTHGASGLRKIFLGSNTTNLIEKTYCPLLAVPSKYKYEGLNKIAYASANLSTLKKELKKIIPIAQSLNTLLEIVHVTSGNETKHQNKNFNQLKFANELSNHYNFYNMSFELMADIEDNLTKSIDRYIKNKKPDMLIMLTQKKNFISKLFFNSNTEEMAYQIKIPLLALRK
jgi:nucleotide-binding universal stress UspA family protein